MEAPLLWIARIGFSTVIGANYPSADALTSNPGGWGGYVIDFEAQLSNFTPATDIFAGLGATFGPGLQWFNFLSTNFGGITGGSLFHSYGSAWQELTVQ